MKKYTEPLWVPPKLNQWEDPLIQEIYWPDRWKMTVTCLCLNMTSGKQVRPVLPILFKRWPMPIALAHAHEFTLKSIIKPLGFVNKRAYALMRMSKEWIETDWNSVKDLYGCGTYANNSDKIFFQGQWACTTPKDGELKRYLEFVKKETLFE